MFERLKRLLKSFTGSSDDDPESFDHPRPQRANPNPPERDWYARVREKSLRARTVSDVKALDDHYAELSPEASQHVDDVLAKMGKTPPPRG